MSEMLLSFAATFAGGRLSANEFAAAYQEFWRIERDSGVLAGDEPGISEKLSSIFVLADNYSADDDRADYELDEDALRARVAEIVGVDADVL
ncbi:MAG: colicin immunity domain-containing protein [Hyphomicrobiales bacterium]